MMKLIAIATLSLYLTVAQPTLGQESKERPSTFTTSPIQEVNVAAQEAGIIRKILVREGSVVENSAIIVQLNQALYKEEAARTEAEWELAKLEASNRIDLKFAEQSRLYNQVNLDRLKRAQDEVTLSVSETELEQSKLELLKAELSEKQANIQIQIAEKREEAKASEKEIAATKLKLRTIQSPLAGMIVELPVEEGEWVQAGDTIARIINYDKLKIKGYLPASVISTSDVGKKIQFVAAKPALLNNPKFIATITFVSPEIKREFFQDPHVRVVAEIDNQKHQLRINTIMKVVDIK